MAAGKEGVLVYDPSIAGTSLATGPTAGGGGLIAAGTYYSRPTTLTGNGWSDVTDVIVFRGTLAGTGTAEVSNASDQEVRDGTDVWAVDSSITVTAVAVDLTALTIDVAPLTFVQAAGSTLTARVATTKPLPTVTASGTGVGKTLTAAAVGILTVDDVALVLNDLVLVKNQANPINNGLYSVTTAGTAGVAFILTRATTMDATGAETTPGRSVAVTAGTVNTGLSFILSGPAQVVLVKAPRIGFGRFRVKFVQSGGLGEITDRRVQKAS